MYCNRSALIWYSPEFTQEMTLIMKKIELSSLFDDQTPNSRLELCFIQRNWNLFMKCLLRTLKAKKKQKNAITLILLTQTQLFIQ